MSKVKDKEKILKTARENSVDVQGNSHKSVIKFFQQKLCIPAVSGMIRKKKFPKNTLPGKVVI